MFTGIIEKIGRVADLCRSGGSWLLALELDELADDVAVGDSVAVDGVCLTATGVEDGTVTFDLSGETVERTTIGDRSRGGAVNVELALRPGDRLGGHFVTGHIDGVGTIRELKQLGEDWKLTVAVSDELTDLLVEKGSVAVDGISLTVAGSPSRTFEVAVVPHTMRSTTLQHRGAGDSVNIECDLLGKYVRKFTASEDAADDEDSTLTVERLKEEGY